MDCHADPRATNAVMTDRLGRSSQLAFTSGFARSSLVLFSRSRGLACRSFVWRSVG